MDKKIEKLILYPVTASNVTGKQRSAIINLIPSIDPNNLSEIIKERISLTELKSITLELSDKDKKECFELAKIIADIETLSLSQVKAFKELGELLEIAKEESGFAFNIYDDNEILNYEYRRTLTNFSIMGSAIGFIPFIPISDYLLLTPLQIGMIAKISNIYNFKIDGEHLIKMIAGTLGAGFIFRSFTQIINKFVPFIGWVINASIGFAGTYAIGIIAKRYIDLNGDLSSENIKLLWQKSFDEGKIEFSRLKDFIFEKKDEVLDYFKNYTNSKKSNDDESNSEKRENSEDEDESDPIYQTDETTNIASKKKKTKKKINGEREESEIFN